MRLPCRGWSREGAPDKLLLVGIEAVVGDTVHQVAIPAIDCSVDAAAQAHRAHNDGVKYGLHIRRGARDDFEDVGRCRLLLQSLGHLHVGFGECPILLL